MIDAGVSRTFWGEIAPDVPRTQPRLFGIRFGNSNSELRDSRIWHTHPRVSRPARWQTLKEKRPWSPRRRLPAEEAAPAEGGEAAAAPVDKLAKWKKATRLQVNAMRATGAKGVPGGLAFGPPADAPRKARLPQRRPRRTWARLEEAGKFVKTATAFVKARNRGGCSGQFRMPASMRRTPRGGRRGGREAAAAAEAPEPSAAASRWAKAKRASPWCAP